MFPRKLDAGSPPSHVAHGKSLSENDEFEANYEISDSGYGKNYVKILHVQRDGPLHTIKEFEVNTHLKLYSKKDYFNGKLNTNRFYIFSFSVLYKEY